MTVIQCRDLSKREALSDGDNGGIDNAERKVEIALHEFRHTADVAVLEFCNPEAITPERLKEGDLCARSDPGLKEIPHLPHNGRRYQERSIGPA